MNGPDHYREAERLLRIAHDRSNDLFGEHLLATLTAAQVHAVLALTAATALGTDREWTDAAGTKLGGG